MYPTCIVQPENIQYSAGDFLPFLKSWGPKYGPIEFIMFLSI